MFTDYRDAFIVTLGINRMWSNSATATDDRFRIDSSHGRSHEISMTIHSDCRGKRSKFRIQTARPSVELKRFNRSHPDNLHETHDLQYMN